MKKLCTVVLFAVILTSYIFGQEEETAKHEVSGGKSAFRVSIGAGGMFSANMSTWIVDEDVPGDLGRYNAALLNTAPYIIFDAKYIELNAGLLLGHAQNSSIGNPLFPADTLGVTFGAYLKLPFALSSAVSKTPAFTLYPLLGARYDLYLVSKKSDGRNAAFPTGNGETSNAREALSTATFSLGMGLDTFFSGHLFLRTELLYGISLPNKMDVALKDARTDVEWQLSHSGDFRLAIGWLF